MTNSLKGVPFGPLERSSFPTGYVSVTTTVPNGSKIFFNLWGRMAAEAMAYDGHALTATYNINFGDTLAWNGVESAKDEAGNLINDLTIVGDDGTSYMQSFAGPAGPPSAVPESSSYGTLQGYL